MNLAFTIFHYFPFGGLQLDFRRILKETLKRGHHVTVIYDRWEGEFISGAEYHKLPVRAWTNWGKSLKFERQAEKYFASHKFDLIVGFNRMKGLDVYFAADDCFAVHSRSKNALIRFFVPRYRILERMEESIFRNGAHTQIFYLAEPQKKAFQNIYHTESERMHFLPPGLSEEFHFRKKTETAELRRQIRNEFNIKEEQVVLIEVCSSFRTKGLDRVITAISSLPESIRKEIILLVVGKEQSGKFGQLAEKLCMQDQIIFTGARSDVWRLLYGADLMVHPARKEATGTVIAEALTCGVPVMVSHCCGYAEMAENAGGIVLNEPFSQAELNHKLCENVSEQKLAELKKNAEAYSAANDFHGRQKLAADFIEEIGSYA